MHFSYYSNYSNKPTIKLPFSFMFASDKERGLAVHSTDRFFITSYLSVSVSVTRVREEFECLEERVCVSTSVSLCECECEFMALCLLECKTNLSERDERGVHGLPFGEEFERGYKQRDCGVSEL